MFLIGGLLLLIKFCRRKKPTLFFCSLITEESQNRSRPQRVILLLPVCILYGKGSWYDMFDVVYYVYVCLLLFDAKFMPRNPYRRKQRRKKIWWTRHGSCAFVWLCPNIKSIKVSSSIYRFNVQDSFSKPTSTRPLSNDKWSDLHLMWVKGVEQGSWLRLWSRTDAGEEQKSTSLGLALSKAAQDVKVGFVWFFLLSSLYPT